ncbi:hypothetical protein HDU98_005362 [Podochytrium sp. JEL0797]|nr:hypothetical protein HDU98_005362 [Podochytrium sp. JEL0797]
MLDVLSLADTDELNFTLPEYLEVYEEKFSVMAGVPLNGCGLSDFTRDSPNYQNYWFKTARPGDIPGIPCQTPKFGKPKPENKPYTLVNGAPVLPVYNSRN